MQHVFANRERPGEENHYVENYYYFVLLRHGESVGNAKGYYQGQSDFELTEKGREQARALARRWQKEGKTFDAIIASPLARARETAEILAAALQIPLELDPVWMERDIGEISGLDPHDAQVSFPPADFTHPFLPFGRTGESEWALYLRAGKAVESILLRSPGRYLIVSHGGLLNKCLYIILGIALQANFQGARFRFRNTAFASITYNPSKHQWTVEGVNERLHWKGSAEED